jgi:hypothetical protein
MHESERELEAEEEGSRQRREAGERADRFHAGDWVPGWLITPPQIAFREIDGESVITKSIKLKTSYGIQPIYGDDLSRAIKESKSKVKVGDAVGVRITRKEEFTKEVKDKRTGEITTEERVYNHYEVERATYIVRRQRAARAILEDLQEARRRDGTVVTASTLILGAAERLADEYRLTTEQRKAFLARVRGAAGISESTRDDPERSAVPDKIAESARRLEAQARMDAFRRQGAWLEGRLLEAKSAPYHRNPRARESFVMTIQTPHGREEIWSGNLKFALEQSQRNSHVKVGDHVSLRITQSEKVSLPQANGERQVRTVNQYEIEKTRYVRRREELANEILDNPSRAPRQGRSGTVTRASYVLMAAAEMLADARMELYEARNSFLATLKAAAAIPESMHVKQASPPPQAAPRNQIQQPSRDTPPPREAFARE